MNCRQTPIDARIAGVSRAFVRPYAGLSAGIGMALQPHCPEEGSGAP